jgi:single-strand DNA-binding protein
MGKKNCVVLNGNLGSDPQLRYTKEGKPVTDLRVATNDPYTTQSGETFKNTQWHKVVVWGKQAEKCAEILRKGSCVYIEGRLGTRTWDDSKGKHWVTEVIAETLMIPVLAVGEEVVQTEDPAPAKAPEKATSEATPATRRKKAVRKATAVEGTPQTENPAPTEVLAA